MYKLKSSNRSESGKFTKLYKLNNKPLKHQQIKLQVTEEIREYLEIIENENTADQNLWDTAKQCLRGKFIAINAYIKK